MKKIDGVLVVNKPSGYTSRDVVNVIGKKFLTKKVGHTGTLDPMAKGVLVIVLGRLTKLVRLLESLDKEYIAEIKLGINTDTLDIMGRVIETKEYNVTKEEILNVFAYFIGKYEMEVPKYSAIKVNGKKLYQYARNGEEVVLPVKEVEIKSLELLDYNEGIIKFKTKVEKGTYIRSLIRDICKSLNTVGVMNDLVRIKQGKFSLDEAYSLDDILNDNYKILNIKEVLNVAEYNLNTDEYKIVKNGGKIALGMKDDLVLLKFNNEDIALYQKEDSVYKKFIMLKVDC